MPTSVGVPADDPGAPSCEGTSKSLQPVDPVEVLKSVKMQQNAKSEIGNAAERVTTVDSPGNNTDLSEAIRNSAYAAATAPEHPMTNTLSHPLKIIISRPPIPAAHSIEHNGWNR